MLNIVWLCRYKSRKYSLAVIKISYLIIDKINNGTGVKFLSGIKFEHIKLLGHASVFNHFIVLSSPWHSLISPQQNKWSVINQIR